MTGTYQVVQRELGAALSSTAMSESRRRPLAATRLRP